MEESPSSAYVDGVITGIRFGLANRQEICTSSNSDCPISHASQLSNPFLGLPLETGKCESCGTAEPGECEGHFGYIELPIPIYHPSHVGELKRMLSLVCLKCLKLKNRKVVKNIGLAERVLSPCCEEASQISVSEAKTADGASYLELKLPSKSHLPENFWNFLERYGFRYGDTYCRPLLPSEVMVILRKIPEDTRKKLSGKGYFPQDGYVLQYLPVPPNCLSVPDVSDGISVMSSDHSIAVLKKVLRQVEVIKTSRSGTPNFESHEIEANDLQAAVAQYLQVRGTAKASRDVDGRYGIKKEPNDSSNKAWIEKLRTLFIRKGSGFSSRSIITGEPYKGVAEIGLPFEIAQRITFEEKVSQHNMIYLQKLVDDKLCLTYKDGSSTYSLREGSKGHTFLRPGQVVHRRIMDGDIVFINRPPTTHKHSLQALRVYVHDDHTVKINPLICGPLSADFDGDAIHLFYPQSLAAKAEVLELFSVEKQLLSSHSGNLNLQLATDSLLSLKMMFKNHFFNRAAAQQLALFISGTLPDPALLQTRNCGPLWTALQLLQTALPSYFDCSGERQLISKSQILRIDYNRDVMQSIINDIVTSIFFGKGPTEVLEFFDSVQPMLMENLYSEGFSVGLEDFYVSKDILETIETDVQKVSILLFHLRCTYNELIELQLEKQIRHLKILITDFILKSSSMGYLIDSKSDSAITKVVQQIGFLGLQISDKGKFYSRTLVGDMGSLFQNKYPSSASYPSEEFGFVRSCLFHGLDPYQSMVHSITSREVIVRSSRGLTEPGTLFKNLMAILRDVVICYDGTVRNVCSNSIIQFEYGTQTGDKAQSLFAAGEPVGVLAATAMSNPAYKAVLDSSPSSNSSWAMMKEILLCGVKFKNDTVDRRVILYLNDCDCGRKYCRENAAYVVKKQLKKVSLKDAAVEFMIGYNKSQQIDYENSEIEAGLVGHIHLNEGQLTDSNISMDDVFEKCQDTINLFGKKKKIGLAFKKIELSVSQHCSFNQSGESKGHAHDMPCLKFFLRETSDIHLERTSQTFADIICPVLLETIIKGDPRVCTADIIWMSSDTTTWIRNTSKNEMGELAIDVVLEKQAVKQSGDAWRVVLDSCLPVIHLIDTRRSTPYAIKQVQELFGISCAFEQAIQRLSTSVTKVAKGVLKEHLILLANSMTCSGNLVGFNKGGIKTLNRSLNVQVPFTEATLFTPKKCFETAAEKCHVDSLSSIVASCSWGKHVSVGTGTSFDILWDTREVEQTQQNGTDVYEFLSMVRGSSSIERASGGLGEIDDLDMLADEYDEEIMSPEHVSKPEFEDMADFDMADETGWNKGQSSAGDAWGKNVVEDSGDGWGKKVQKSGEDSRDGWVKKVERSGEDAGDGWGKKAEKLGEDAGDGWGKKVEWSGEDAGGGWGKKAESLARDSGDGWGKKLGSLAGDSGDGWVKKVESSSKDSGGGWAKKVESLSKGSGDGSTKKAERSSEDSGDGWGKKAERSGRDSGDGWSEKVETSRGDSEDGWGKIVERSGGEPQQSGWGKNADGNNIQQLGQDVTYWNKKDSQPLPKRDDVWGKQSDESSGSSWAKQSEESSGSGWGKVDKAAETQRNKKESQRMPEQSRPFTSSAAGILGKRPAGDSETGWGKKDVNTSWNRKDGQPLFDQVGPVTSPVAGAWGKESEDDSGNAWAKKAESSWRGEKKADEPVDTRWSKKQSPPSSAGAWQETSEKDSEGGWGKKVKSSESESAGGWGKRIESSEPESAGVWGKKIESSEPESAGGWGKKIESSDPESAGGWGNMVKSSNQESAGGWGNMVKSSNQESAGGWGKKFEDAQQSSTRPAWAKKGDEGERTPWSKKEGRPTDRPTGWTKKEGWGRNRPFKPTGVKNDETGVVPPLSATGRRLDSFTAEEHDILSEIESVMQSIRKIMNQSGYSDGDPVSAEDQVYIVDNVFNYHPDKVTKMGAGIDYVMVNKHSNFQDTRCLYIVCTDGRKEDFSYRKCLENFIKGKYPDQAEAFNAKYFRQPQKTPRPGWNRERSAAPDEGGTDKPRGSRSSPTPDEANKPRGGWGSPMPEEANKPRGGGWGSPVPDETSIPRGSWGSPVPEEANKPRGSWGSAVPEEAAAIEKKVGGWGSSVVPEEAGGTEKKSGGWGSSLVSEEAASGKKSGGWE